MTDHDPLAWHRLTTEESLDKLDSDPGKGLDDAVAAARLAEYGPNQIATTRKYSPVTLFFRQFANVMILVLLAAAVISGLVGELADTVAILVILLLNAVIGFVQEFRAERALEALQAIATPEATVRRQGVARQLPTEDLVPGDIVLLEAGGLVPADLRLLEVAQLRVDEAALTGESVPVEKDTPPIDRADVTLGDRADMAHKGTLVTHGRAVGLVVATGMSTELGRIAHLLGTESRLATPLQKRLARFGRRLSGIVLALCALILAVGVLRGEDVLLMFMTAISLAVAAIPEALPAVVTISLALGARRMVRQQSLIRRLPAVETLGSVTYICSDKTGTLTRNSMRAERFFVDGEQTDAPPPLPEATEVWRSLLLAMTLNNDAAIGERDETGDPTELALLHAASSAGADKAALEADWPRIGELPFDAVRKRMTTLHHGANGWLALAKGAPETLLPLCGSEVAAKMLRQAEDLAGQGYRVLAFAQRRFDSEPGIDQSLESNLEFLGLVALMDPEREEAAAAVAEARAAGITPVMVTGDHPATALAMARRLGIADAEAVVLTGPELASLDAEQRIEILPQISVYARVSPEQKIEIVRALQQTGELVAMTGDGVNDAPALKRADIGVAMGRKGTDVAREAADMILLDDNFATIVAAVREGRRIYDNIRRFIRYTMTSNTGEVLSLALAPLLGLPLPFLPIQILWIDLVTDGLPGLALSVERAEPDVMRRPPRPPDEGIFVRSMWQQVVWLGVLIAALTLGVQGWAISQSSENWQTMAFTVLTLSQLVNALAVRSETESLFRLGLFTNRPLFLTLLGTTALQLAVIYWPPLQEIFHTTALTASELAICFLLPLGVLLATEVEKKIRRIRSGRMTQTD